MIKGQTVTLRPATPEDRRSIYEWLILWDELTANHKKMSWDEFCCDYQDFFFDGSRADVGRCFVIVVEETPVGQINYHTLYPHDNHTELDIWMKDEESCGQGFGSEALKILCDYLFKEFGIQEFIIRPSIQNQRAIRAYQKAGFRHIECSLAEQTERYSAPDSDDCLVMKRKF